jgi:hypothetical protein
MDQVIAAQRKILGALAAWESRIGELYDIYAKLYPLNRRLWQALAAEERQHAALLLTLNQELDAGHLFWDIGKFGEDAIAPYRDFVDDAIEKVLSNSLSDSEIMETALAIEGSLLEARFYVEVTSDSPRFVHIAKALVNATDHHIGRLKTVIQDHAGDNNWKG